MQAVYVPWLHMHQPLVWHKNKLMSNLMKMLLSSDSKESWEAKLIARAYKNPAKYVLELNKEGLNPKIMLDFSGILLESLNEMKRKLKGIDVHGEKIGNIIGLYKKVLSKYPSCIEFAGTAYSHCYFPATPEEDWYFQIEEWRDTFKKLFGAKQLKNVKGFWLPEMGIPGNKEKLARLIRFLKDFGYEWMILPIEAVEGEKYMSFEQRVIMTSQPHKIEINNESIPVVFRVRYDFIDQQAGCDAKGVYEKSILAAKIFSKISKKPALVVPASDGENGNVMMNEFFPNTFLPFFKKFMDKKVTSMTISEFLYKFYTQNDHISTKSIVTIAPLGSSWIGGHEKWLSGEERLSIKKQIDDLSKSFHEIINKNPEIKNKPFYEDVKRSLLLAETSCYVYWGTSYWFEQGKKMIAFTRKRIEKLKGSK